MLILSSKQLKLLNQIPFNHFVKEMKKSIIENLEIEEDIDLTQLKELINKIGEQFYITDEDKIEDYLLCYFHYPVMRLENVPEIIDTLLRNKIIKQDMKMDELLQILITDSY
jgi:hypothetical protein